MRALIRTVRCLWAEGALVAVGLACLATEDNVGAAVGGALAAAVGGWGLWRSGALQLAWRTPRIEALGVRASGGRALPWETLRLAEAVLARFEQDGVRAYRSFFPELRGQLRAVTQAAVDAPESAAVLQERLGALLARLDSCAVRRERADPLSRLAELEQRAGALSEAVGEVRPGGHRIGGGR